MRALVTGASGFVGRHLVRHLEDAGDTVVRADRLEDGLDITDAERLRALVDRARADAVYHLAGWSDVGASWNADREVFRTNAEGTLSLLLACRDAGVGRVLVVSSADVYGIVEESALPITEDFPMRPVTPYAASKASADLLALQAFLGRGTATIRVRAFNHLGPGQSDRFVAPGIAARIARNERDGGDTVPVGNLTPRRDFTDVRDVVRAYRLLVEHAEPGQAYNVCSGTDVAIADLAAQLLAMATRPMHLEIDADLVRPIDVPVLRGDHRRLTEATGWAPEIPLERTLADLLDDYRTRVLPA
jgi:GDP-4-dehydro-6-deoxy-D-mannose reductase